MRSRRTLFITACVVLALVATATAASAMTVGGISPASATKPLIGTSSVSVTVSGYGFVAGAQVKLVGGGTTIQATGETVSTGMITLPGLPKPTYIKCSLPVTSGAYVGSYTLYVTNPGLVPAWVSKANAFTVKSLIIVPAMTVTGISRTGMVRGMTYTSVYVYGTGFPQGAQVRLSNGGTSIDAAIEYTEAPGRIRCNVAVPDTAPLGTYTLTVIQPGTLKTASKPGAVYIFSVTPSPTTTPAPTTVSGISPSSATRPSTGSSTIVATVSGTGFRAGDQVRLAGGGTTIYATGETAIGTTAIRCTLAVPSTAYVGYYTVSVQHAGTTTWYAKASAFRVLSSSLTVTGTSPRTLTVGRTQTITVYGTNFRAGAQVRLTRGTSTLFATGEQTISAGQIRCVVTLPLRAPIGAWTVGVQNTGMPSWAINPLVFVMLNPQPEPPL